MSMYCVVIYPDTRDPDAGWVELVDTLAEASAYLREHPGHVAFELDDDGEATGVMLKVDLFQSGFLRSRPHPSHR